jgi:nucleotide-binding universal stress UspA family protein
MYGRILVPLDGSELGEAVLPHVEGLADRLRAEVTLIRVANVPATLVAEASPMEGPMPTELINDAIDAEASEAREYLAGVSDRLKQANVQAHWEVVEGEPARAIIDAAHRHDNDLIAMATHGRSGLPHLLLGSVAYRVLRDSHLPVLLVRPPVPPPEP